MTKRILHIIDQYKIGGPGKTILNSVRFIDQLNYEIHVATFLPNGTESTELSKKVCETGIPHLFLPDVRGLSMRNLHALRSYIRKHKIGIFHCHGYKSEIYAHLLKSFCRSTVFVITYHGWIEKNLSSKMIVQVTKLLSFRLDGIIAVANEMLTKLPAITKRRNVLHVIHNAVVIEDYPPGDERQAVRRRYGIGSDELVLGVIGRLSPEKGCLEAVDALVHLHGQGIPARLMMIGDGPLKVDLINHVRGHGLEDRVVFTGHVHPVHPLYTALDIVVSPSRTEGISNVILEAMVFRKPVVATRVGGTPEIITDSHNGILVPPGDAKALCNAVEKIALDSNLSNRIVENAYTTIHSHFEFKQRMRKVERFYEEVMAVSHLKLHYRTRFITY